MMKNYLLLLIGLFLAAGMNAQDAKSALKDAKKAYSSYQFNNDVEELKTASEKIEVVMSSDEYASDPKNLILRGNIYGEMVKSDVLGVQMGKQEKPMFPDAAFKAVDAFKMAHAKAQKGFRKTEALDGIRTNAPYLNQVAFGYYENGKYEEALELFEQGLSLNDLLVSETGKGMFESDSAYSNQVFLSSVMATQAGNTEKAEMYLTKLKDMNYEDPIVYTNLYKLYQESDPSKAVGYLEEGRQKFPDNVSLLFAEINHYLSLGELDVLIGKLEKAIEAEPENASVRMTLGSVYEQLQVKEREAGNMEKSKEYFDKALTSYKDALSLSPNDAKALYSVGALYYNKAAGMVGELNELSDDYSDEGTKKYNAVKAQMDNLFDQALPYFEDALKADPTDRNTLIALKEMYVRKGDLEKSEKIKKELEKIGG